MDIVIKFNDYLLEMVVFTVDELLILHTAAMQ